jgi:sugar phosphate isomerase/epimerase
MIELAYIAPEMDADFERAVALGTGAGVKAVALRSPLWGKQLEDLTNNDVRRMRDILAVYGMHVSALYSSAGKCSIVDEAALARGLGSLPRVFELARAFGTSLVRVFPFQRPGYTEYEPSHLDEYLERIAELWAPLVARAESEGIVLVFEGVGSTLARTARELQQVCQALGASPAVGIVWEVDVAFRAGEPPSHGYSFASGFIRDVHIKRNPDLPLSGPGESYERVLRMLVGAGYHGPVTLEHWPGPEGTLSALAEVRQMLSRLAGMEGSQCA